jgi:hypothetical protein
MGSLVAAEAQGERKALKNMDPAQRRQFMKDGGMAGKCKYDRCYSKCMEKRGIDQWSNAKCAERCSRVMGCV